LVNVEASRDRLELAAEAGCLALAADAAETIRAENSLEKMLAHQLATAHRLSMAMAGRAAMHTANASHADFGLAQREFHATEAVQAAGAAARMMDVFQRGLLTLQRLRTGGRQTVVVQHVVVGDGGQAAIVATGTMNTRGHRRGTNQK
jgi:hypothetical protein